LALLAALLLWLYARVLIHLVAQWAHDPNFSHGFLVPLFSAYVLWRKRARLASISLKPSRTGLFILAFALCILIVGQLGAELFLARVSLLFALAGLIILFCGWPFFRAILFPWAFLLLMIPIPVILFNQITFPLQLLASRISADILELLGVPVALNGNILQLAAMPLNVAEACSGIRSLMSLLTLAIIYGYLVETEDEETENKKRLWIRWLLALASLPIAIAANSVRIIGTGLLVQHGYANAAEGYFHASWGLITFAISLLMLYALHALIRLLFREKEQPATSATVEEPSQSEISPPYYFVLAALLLASAAIFLQAHTRSETFPPRLALNQFPQQLAAWTSTDIPIDQETLDVLGHGEFLHRIYQKNSNEPDIDLFLAYFPSQRAGETPHSPQHCLPGSGWTPVENQRLTLVLPGHDPFPANRYIITKGNSREMVLYWFWAHNRGVASEYWAKYFLVKDSIQMNRSDGALVRIVTPMLPDETPAAALHRLLPFAAEVVPQLNRYIPR
jgi:exosortase D (VPLPA-CTERM-specific)